eukprot:scaffold154352_cov22-Tisochrysis_lutea.AAC.1
MLGRLKRGPLLVSFCNLNLSCVQTWQSYVMDVNLLLRMTLQANIKAVQMWCARGGRKRGREPSVCFMRTFLFGAHKLHVQLPPGGSC